MSIDLPLTDVPPGTIRRVELDGEPVAVCNVDGEIFAVSDRCTHASIPLSDGDLEGRQIICPWHGAMFDLKTGRPTCGPAVDPLRLYHATLNGETITIDAE